MSVCQSASMSAAHKMLTNCKKGTWSLDKRESFSIFISLFQFVKRRLTRKHVFGFCWSWLLRWWKDYWRCRPDIIVSAVFRCGLTLGPQFGSVVPRGWLFAWGNWQIPHRWLRWRWLNEFFPHQKQLLKMSPKVRDSWYRIVLFPTVETTLRTVAAITLWIWHGWGCSCMSSSFFFVVSDGWIGLYPSLCFLLAAQPLPPSSSSWVFDSESPSPPFPCGVCGCSSEHWAATSKGHPSCLVPRHMAICQCADRHPTVGAKTWIHAVIFSKSTWIHDSCNSCGVFMTCGNCGSKYSKALPLIYSLVQVLKNEFWPHFHFFLTLIVRRLDFHPTARVTSLSFLGLVLHMT